jgi:hypothetical protein
MRCSSDLTYGLLLAVVFFIGLIVLGLLEGQAGVVSAACLAVGTGIGQFIRLRRQARRR